MQKPALDSFATPDLPDELDYKKNRFNIYTANNRQGAHIADCGLNSGCPDSNDNIDSVQQSVAITEDCDLNLSESIQLLEGSNELIDILDEKQQDSQDYYHK